MENPKPNKTNYFKIALMAFIAVGFGIMSFSTYRSPELFTAAITGGSVKTVTTDLYIPSDYKASAGESGYVELMAGKEIKGVTTINLTLGFDKNKVSLSEVEYGDTLPRSYVLTGSLTSDERYNIMLTFNTPTDLKVNDKLVKIKLNLVSGLSAGDKIFLWKDSLIITASPQISNPTYTPGEITIGTTSDICKTVTCPENALCDSRTGECVCKKGYDPVYLCSACIAGYTGYPDCKIDVLSNVDAVFLTMERDTLLKLTTEERVQAYGSAFVLINSSGAAGKTITLEGQDIPIPAHEAGVTEAQKINSITNQMKTLLAVTGVNVTSYTSAPGILKLMASTGNPDNSLDGIVTNSGDVIIIPGMAGKIILHPVSSYQMRVVAKNTNGSAQELNFNNVKWQPQPVNRLSSTALAGGLLEKGDKTGVAPLYAQVEKADGSTVDSNQITIDVPSGPIIEYIRIIGSKPIERGGRISMSVKLSDVDQISDIKDIRTFIVRSSQDTYAGINKDAGAAWFTATAVKSEVSTTDSGTQVSDDPSDPSAPETSSDEYYRIYSIPVEVPQDSNMIDGAYKLVFEITDIAGNLATSVLSINIGSIASGDVDGDGKITMLDVIIAFQIATGTLQNPTQAQLQAADMDKDGKVTMLDVINLFNKLGN